MNVKIIFYAITIYTGYVFPAGGSSTMVVQPLLLTVMGTAGFMTWAAAGDMRNIVLMGHCRQEDRNAPDTGRFAVCPNCGNLYPSEYADWYCPACLTEGKRFVLFE